MRMSSAASFVGTQVKMLPELTVHLCGVCDVGVEGLQRRHAAVGVHRGEAHERHHGCRGTWRELHVPLASRACAVKACSGITGFA